MHGILQNNFSDSGKIFNVTVNVDHHYQFAYNKSDNSMLGFRIIGWINGNSNDSKLRIEYDYHTELVGYNLPDLTFPLVAIDGGGSPTGNGNLALILSLSIGIPVILILITTIAIVVNKKKKK
jgi:hypothetical protein